MVLTDFLLLIFIVNSDQLNSTSSSNESVSSLSSRDVTNHNSYSTVTPQKNKRGKFCVIQPKYCMPLI